MSRTDKNSGLLPELLEAAGYDPAAVEVARIAAAQGFAAANTVALLEAVDPKAAGLARTVLDAALPVAEDAPAGPERSASQTFSDRVREAAGRGTPDEAVAAAAEAGAQGRADAETFQQRTPADTFNHTIRVAAGVIPPDDAA